MDTGGCVRGVKRPGREADHSSSAEVKECVEVYLHLPIPSTRDVGASGRAIQGEAMFFRHFDLRGALAAPERKCR